MKTITKITCLATSIVALSLLTLTAGDKSAAKPAGIANPAIDYPKFLEEATAVGELREKRRLTEEQFMEMAAEPETVILDARSAAKFAQLHIKGATNLSLPDITAEELQRILPKKDTKVLIYCNNNFLNEPVAFAAKCATASLNIHTFNVLHNYGYTNVYELGPLIDIKQSKLPFEGSLRQAK